MGGLNSLVTNDTVRHIVSPATMVQDKIIENNPDNPYASFFAPESKRAQQLELGRDSTEAAFDPGGFFSTVKPSAKRQAEIDEASADSAEAGWDRYNPTAEQQAQAAEWVRHGSGMARGGRVASEAKGLASLGRGGDDTLVHMSKQELHGLQNLAARHGTTLTTNPHTGLPEAFNLGKLLPTLAGVAVGIVAPEALPWIAAATAGAEKASGKSWGEAIGTGLQVYGGGSLTAGLTAAGEGATLAEVSPAADGVATGITSASGAAGAGAAEAAAPVATEYAGADLVAATPTTSGIGAIGGSPTDALMSNMTPESADILSNTGGVTAGNTGIAATTTPSAGGITSSSAIPSDPNTVAGRLDYTGQGASSLKGWEQAFGGTNMAAKAGLGSAAIGAFSEDQKPPEEEKPVYYIADPKTGKSLYSPGTVNPNIAKYGYLPAGQAAFTDQHFNPGVYSYSMDHYDPVANMRSGGLAGIRRMADGGATAPANDKQAIGQEILASNQPLPAAQQGTDQAALQSMNTQFANQATTGDYPQMAPAPQSPTAMNDWMAHYNQMITPQPQGVIDTTAPTPATDTGGTTGKTLDALTNAAKNDPNSPSYAPPDVPPLFAKFSVPFGKGEPPTAMYDARIGKYVDMKTGQPVPDHWRKLAAGGGITSGGDYAAGGKLLRGPGDGMSDSIPAMITGSKPQRAALADGEFVVPADVVSHLGNGSTEAGSRKLYAMMHKIRKDRTGRQRQAPAVNPDKYLPR